MTERVTERTPPVAAEIAERFTATDRAVSAARPADLTPAEIAAIQALPRDPVVLGQRVLRWTDVYLAAVSGLVTRGLTPREVVVAATAVADEATR